MKKYQRILAKAGASLAALAAPVVTLAQSPYTNALTQVNAIATNAHVASDRTLPQVIGSIINAVLGFLGIILLGYLLYAGFLWMTSGGESEKAGEAQTMIKNAVIGLIIIVASFAISSFVLNQLTNIAGTS